MPFYTVFSKRKYFLINFYSPKLASTCAYVYLDRNTKNVFYFVKYQAIWFASYIITTNFMKTL